VLVRLQPPELHTSVVKRRTRLPPKEQVQVRILAGVLTASVVKRTSHGSTKPGFLVRVQVEALWPNPNWMREPAVNRGCVGSTPTGHPETPAMLDRPGTALVTRTKWVRVPPLALIVDDAGAGRPGGRPQPDSKQVRLLPASLSDSGVAQLVRAPR
jgi:hypothetical protein